MAHDSGFNNVLEQIKRAKEEKLEKFPVDSERVIEMFREAGRILVDAIDSKDRD